MPELPEVETIRRDLAVVVSGQKIKAVKIFSLKTASHSAVFLTRRLAGRKIMKVERRGKLLIFKLNETSGDGDSQSKTREFNYFLIHLKMTGQLIYLDAKTKIAGGHSSSNGHSLSNGRSLKSGQTVAAAPNLENSFLPNKHTRAIIEFAHGGRLFFNDLRKFGYLKLVTEDELARLLAKNYGPEPLTAGFSLPVLSAILRRRSIKIKALLLNQQLISGLGNIYVDEVLWAARLNPERPAASLTAAEIKKLYQAINQLIKKAIAHRGTTFNNYVDSHGRKGNFSRFLKVYGRRGEKCPRCHRPIARKKVAGRGTHYCPDCQK